MKLKDLYLVHYTNGDEAIRHVTPAMMPHFLKGEIKRMCSVAMLPFIPAKVACDLNTPQPSPAPEPTNAMRTDMIKALLIYFKAVNGLQDEPPEEVIGDLLANIMHYCDTEEVDFDLALHRAYFNYRTEVINEGGLPAWSH